MLGSRSAYSPFPRFSWGLPRRLHERSRRFAAANPSCSRSALAFARSLCGQRGLQAPVQSKEVLDALALGHEARTAVETVDGAVQRVMCSSKIRRHQVGVVEIGQRRVRVSSAGVEHGLRKSLQCRQTRVLALEASATIGQTGWRMVQVGAIRSRLVTMNNRGKQGILAIFVPIRPFLDVVTLYMSNS